MIGPYDVYLKRQSPAYRKAWGEFVVAQLDQHLSQLRGLAAEVHAGEAYVTPLQAPLAARRATLITPLAHLGQGEQLAWYATGGSRSAPAPAMTASAASVSHADVQYLA